MEDLTPRQRHILTCIIESHISTSLPVGSRTLSEHYRLSLSPASLRNEMGVLEEWGYLTHPHTSAGRVPTDKGYQFYVKAIVKEEPVSTAVLNLMAKEMKAKIENLESFMERSSQLLSAMAEEAVLATFPVFQQLYLKELSLIPLDPQRVLAVWCTTSGLVQNRLVEIKEPASLEEVERIRNFINVELAGELIEDLERKLAEKLASCRDSLRYLYERTLQVIRESASRWSMPKIFIQGSRYILNQPEFQDLKKIQLLMDALETKSSLLDLLSQPQREKGLHIAIGEKDLFKEIWDCSLVSAPYEWKGRVVGAVAVLGPRRMPYGRIMGLVHWMSGEMSQAMSRLGA